MNLTQWLDAIQALHPNEIDLGLQRLRMVAQRLGLGKPAPLVITVAGTNGKGSTVTMLNSIFMAAGYRAGTYTSPHLLKFNERVTVAGAMASDEALCECFALIDSTRAEISLTYFEFSTLAGLMLLAKADLDVAILEVGLGGRLDATNLIDPDLAIITSIGLDHQDWLGDTRELIGLEKAGIFRSAVPAVVGDTDIPASIEKEAARLGCPIYRQNYEFGFTSSDGDWNWWGQGGQGFAEEQMIALARPALDLINAATVLQAIALQPLPVSRDAIVSGLEGLGLQGRFQRLRDPLNGHTVRLDVAHNPHAAILLSSKLRAAKLRGEIAGKVRAVVAMMGDKDQVGFYEALESEVDVWYIAAFAQPRCQDAPSLYAKFQKAGATVIGPFDRVENAFTKASNDATSGDLILVTGSFATVADALEFCTQLSLQGIMASTVHHDLPKGA